MPDSTRPYPAADSPARRPWCYDSLFPRVREAWDTHSRECESFQHIWLGRTGGVSCPSDLGDCDDCGVTFYNEGLMGQYGPGWQWGDPILHTDDCEARLCDCCGRKRRAAHSDPSGQVSS